jgi:hypothetical protein
MPRPGERGVMNGTDQRTHVARWERDARELSRLLAHALWVLTHPEARPTVERLP